MMIDDDSATDGRWGKDLDGQAISGLVGEVYT
jgi:hypothetical protein